jgi:hypothetical protein
MGNTILTLAEVEAALEGSRTRGDYLPAIKNFFATRDLAIDMSEKFPGKVAASLRNSVQQNCDKAVKDNTNGNAPAFKVVVKGKGDDAHVLIVNLDALAKLQAEATEPTDDDEVEQ